MTTTTRDVRRAVEAMRRAALSVAEDLLADLDRQAHPGVSRASSSARADMRRQVEGLMTALEGGGNVRTAAAALRRATASYADARARSADRG